MKGKLGPIKQCDSESKERKHHCHAKKISLNFDLFNPKRRSKGQCEDSAKINYEELSTNNK
jgi:hypothetical protein